MAPIDRALCACTQTASNTVSSITEQMPLSITHLPENMPHPLRHRWLVYLPLAVLWQTDGRLTLRPSVLWSHWLLLWSKHHLIEAWSSQIKSRSVNAAQAYHNSHDISVHWPGIWKTLMKELLIHFNRFNNNTIPLPIQDSCMYHLLVFLSLAYLSLW